jgi:hypothetical protein
MMLLSSILSEREEFGRYQVLRDYNVHEKRHWKVFSFDRGNKRYTISIGESQHMIHSARSLSVGVKSDTLVRKLVKYGVIAPM